MARDETEAEKMENGLTILTRVDWEGIVAAVVADLRPEVEALRARAETAEREMLDLTGRLETAQAEAAGETYHRQQAERERDAARAEITALRGELHHVEACNRKLYADSQRLDFMESLRRVTAGFWIHRDDGTGRGFRWMGDGHLRAAIDAARAAAPAEEGA